MPETGEEGPRSLLCVLPVLRSLRMKNERIRTVFPLTKCPGKTHRYSTHRSCRNGQGGTRLSMCKGKQSGEKIMPGTKTKFIAKCKHLQGNERTHRLNGAEMQRAAGRSPWFQGGR